MGKTDQAFIDAYRRQPSLSAKPPTSTASPEAPVTARLRESPATSPHAVHGPHVRFSGGAKAPLSQVLQAREAVADDGDAADALPISAAPAATQLSRFLWPDTVAELVREDTPAFATIVEGVQNLWPIMGFVGCRPGSGATTVTLVVARLLAAQGLPVAVIDADPAGPSLACELGLKRHVTIANTLTGGLPLPSATVHADDEGVSLLVAGPITQHPAMVGQMLQELRQTHAAVLIDLGSDPRGLVLTPDAVALVHPFDESDAVIEYSSRSLRDSGAKLVGTVQTMAPAA